MTRRWLALFLLATAPHAQAADTPAPHGLGLLAGRVSDAAAAERLRAGLRDPRPETRAAAVRVVNVSRVDGLLPEIQDALARETDPPAASEMMRLLGALAHPEADAAVLAAAERLGFPTHAALADGLGRRGATAYAHLPRLRALKVEGSALGTFYRLATRAAVDPLGPAAAPILRDGADEAWAMLLEDARAAGVTVDAGLLVAAVRAPPPAMRAATYWHIALLAVGKAPGAALTDAVRGTPEATGQGADPLAAVSHEIARRALDPARRTPVLALTTLPAGFGVTVPRDALLDDRIVDLLTKAEKKKLEAAVYGTEGWLSRVEKPSKKAAWRRDARDVPALAFTRTLSDLPPGYVTDVMAASGCRPSGKGGMRGGVATYGADGRPQAVMLLEREDTPACEEATRVLIASSLAPLGVPTRAGDRGLVLLPDRKGYLECVEEAARTPAQTPEQFSAVPDILQGLRQEGGEWPTLPASAIRARVTGTVFMEAGVAPSGCVHRVVLVRGVDPRLDVAAIEAAATRRFRLPRFEGVPPRIEIRATTTFR